MLRITVYVECDSCEAAGEKVMGTPVVAGSMAVAAVSEFAISAAIRSAESQGWNIRIGDSRCRECTAKMAVQ